MFSEIMPPFTELAEMKTKNSQKRALYSITCSRGALSIVDKIENWKNTKKKKLLPSMRRRKMKYNSLHAALVLNITYWQFTNLKGIHSAVDGARVLTTE